MNKRLKIFFFLSALSLALPCYVFTQTIDVQIDTNSILIGDQINLSIKTEFPPGTEVFWPIFKSDTLIKGIEILEISQVDTSLGKTFRMSQNVLITSFDSGYYAVPPIPVWYRHKGDVDTSQLLSEPFLLEVKTIPADTAIDLADIKPPIDTPLSWEEIWHFVKKNKWWFIGLALFIIAGILFLIFGKKRKKEYKPVEIKRDPPHVIALDSLLALKQKQLWQVGKIKEYYTELTDIVRLYIENRFDIGAMEMTTDEIMTCFKSIPVSEELKAKLNQLLFLSDMVKFAKNMPISEEHEMSFSGAEQFVRETIPVMSQTNVK